MFPKVEESELIKNEFSRLKGKLFFNETNITFVIINRNTFPSLHFCLLIIKLFLKRCILIS